MSLCFVIFEYKNLKFAAFKGDDSAVDCDKCTYTEKGKEIIAMTGHGLKLHSSPIGEFAGWFLTEYGLFPDVLRYSAKFFDKLYRDEQHFEEVKTGLQERVTAVKNSHQLRAGTEMCAMFYNQLWKGTHGMTAEDAENLFSFLKCSRKIRFSELTPVTLPIRTVEPAVNKPPVGHK